MNERCYEHSLWLLPSEPLAEKLRGIIRQLSTDYDAVDFEPHVTLSCGPSSDKESEAIAKDLVEHFPPVTLTATKLDYTSLYTKTLFIQFEESTTADSMFEFIKNRSAKPQNHVLNPHLSLLYKAMTEKEQRALSETLDAPLGDYHFDRLRIIETEVPLTQPEQIRRWRTVLELPLPPLKNRQNTSP